MCTQLTSINQAGLFMLALCIFLPSLNKSSQYLGLRFDWSIFSSCYAGIIHLNQPKVRLLLFVILSYPYPVSLQLLPLTYLFILYKIVLHDKKEYIVLSYYYFVSLFICIDYCNSDIVSAQPIRKDKKLRAQEKYTPRYDAQLPLFPGTESITTKTNIIYISVSTSISISLLICRSVCPLSFSIEKDNVLAKANTFVSYSSSSPADHLCKQRWNQSISTEQWVQEEVPEALGTSSMATT